MTSETKSAKPVELSSIINVIQHDSKSSHRSPYDKMELKSVVHVEGRKRSSNGVKGHHDIKSQKSSISILDKPILLLPFGHQVSGRASMLCYDETTILKPYVSRELYFYQTMPQELKKLTPQFRGLVTVSFIEDTLTATLLAYALPQTLVKPNAKSILKLFTEEPKPHSKRCVKDFGKSHVIYPDNPTEDNTLFNDSDENVKIFIEDANRNISSAQDDDDVMSGLSQGFDSSVYIDDAKASGKENIKIQSSTGLHNPWNTKVLDDAWLKLKVSDADDPATGKKKRFTLLENVVAYYRRPCVLDLKIGTRIRENASSEKIARHVTAINLGARLSGMQIYHPEEERFTYHNKYFGHNLTVYGLKANLRHFFSRGMYSVADNTENRNAEKLVDNELVRQAIWKLQKLKDIVESMKSHRFYSSSLLLLYEGDIQRVDSVIQEGSTDDTISPITKSHNDPELLTKSPPKTFSLSEFLHKIKQHNYKNGKRHHENSSSKDRTNSRKHHHHNRQKYMRGSAIYKHEKKEQKALMREHRKSRHSQEKEQEHVHLDHKDKSKENHCKFSESNSSDCGKSRYFSTRKQNHKNEDFLSKSWPPRKKPDHNFDPPFHECHGIPTEKSDLVIEEQLPQDTCENSVRDLIDVKMIDFAHYCFHDEDMHPGPDKGFIFGLENLILILSEMLKL